VGRSARASEVLGDTALALAQALRARQRGDAPERSCSVVTDHDVVRTGTARITVTAAALVLGLSSSAVLPLLLPWQGEAALASTSLLLSLLPFAAFALVARRRSLAVTQLTHWFGAAGGVALLSALAVVPLFHVYRGQVRVLNHGDEPFVLWVDGKRVARIEPSSGESALAGVWLTPRAARASCSERVSWCKAAAHTCLPR
jgi:hypothetical protein